MARHANLMDDRSGDFEGSSVAFLVDAFCISMSALMGMSPSTVFVESASGIAEGGRTGLTAITTSAIFFLSLFFSPILSSIPSWATGSVLVLVGSMMAKSLQHVNWDHPKDAIPAFLALTLIPFTFNIAYGLIAAIITWIILHNVPMLLHKLSGGRIAMPPGWDDSEPYSASFLLANAAAGDTSNHSKLLAILPPWLRRALLGKRRFWEMEESELEAYIQGRRITADKAARKADAKQQEWAEERAAMMRIKEAGQDLNMPPHHREFPVPPPSTSPAPLAKHSNTNEEAEDIASSETGSDEKKPDAAWSSSSPV